MKKNGTNMRFSTLRLYTFRYEKHPCGFGVQVKNVATHGWSMLVSCPGLPPAFRFRVVVPAATPKWYGTLSVKLVIS